MKFLSVAALLVLAPAPALCAPTPAAAGEMELHIEARGSVPADYPIVRRTLVATERGKPASEAELAAQIAKLKARLLQIGVPASAITVAEPTYKLTGDGDFRFGAPAAMMAVAMEAPVGVADPDVEEEAVPTAAEGAVDAAQAAADAANAAKAMSKQVARKRKLPYWSGSADYSVRLDDIKLYPAVAEVVGGNFRSTDENTDFRFNAPDTVHARALAEALANARTEADLHATALGAHVVRIARVSNRETPVTMPEIAAFMVQMDQRKNSWRLTATHSASVAIDYVIAPN